MILVSIIAFSFDGNSQSSDQNYIKSTIYQTETEDGIVTTNDKIESITYYDGLGRSTQKQLIRAGGGSENLIVPIFYDYRGRITKDYLPLPLTNGTGEYYTGTGGINIDQEIKTFYKTKFPDDFYQGGGNSPDWDNPFMETIYEESARSLILEQSAPGFDWKAHYGSEHTTKIEYGIYITSVYQFSVNFINGDYSDPELIYDGDYTPQSLNFTVLKDENWDATNALFNRTIEYTDKSGRIILRRKSVEDPGKGPQDPNYHDTYFIYDDFGNLTYILSPEASDKIINGGSIVQSVLDNLGYQYKFDSLNRVIEKKLPGKGWEYFVYDTLDRPVLAQDANLKLTGEWLFTKYDVFNRPVYTGLYSPVGILSRETLQQTAETVGLPLNEIQSTGGTQIGDVLVYYSNSGFPVQDIEVLTIGYYDSYVDMANLALPQDVYGVNPNQTNVQTLPTVSKVRVLGTTDWITTISGYDAKARQIYMGSQNDFLNTTNSVKSLYDFTGNLIESTSTHLKSGNTIISGVDYFTYDQIGRLITHEQKIDNEPVQLITENFYNDIGQLVRKNVGGETFVNGFTDINGVDVTFEGTVEKTNTVLGYNSGLKTRGKILDTGGVSYTLLTENKGIKVGFYETTQALVPYDYLHYGIINTDEASGAEYKLKYIENGVEYYTSPPITYKDNDVFKLERINSTDIAYSKNGVVFHTAQNVSTSAMLGKAVFDKPNGKIENFKLFGSNIDKVLQNIDYTYNVRGWLTEFNEIQPSGTFLDDDLFKFRINYNNVDGNTGATPLYNGNIAQTLWKTTNVDKDVRTYTYSYDDLNRIKMANSYQGTNLQSLSLTNNHDLSNISYDKNGNILTLNRRGYDNDGTIADLWDDLIYTYSPSSPNQLIKVEENSTTQLKDYGFKNGYTGLNDDYEYDSNGNMTRDRNKGILSITYNHLNLPTEIVFEEVPKRILYAYSANGNKMNKTVINQNSITTEYAGGFVYNDAETSGEMKLKFFKHPEGYVEPVANTSKSVKGFDEGTGATSYSTYNYIFQYKDHIGNVRLSYTDLNNDGAINSSTEIIEESNFYPFGLKQNGYNLNNLGLGSGVAQQWKFQGQERQEDLDLKWDSFKWRNSDASLGRFFSTDPLSESYVHNSPYAFSENRVIDGMEFEGLEYVDAKVSRIRLLADGSVHLNMYNMNAPNRNAFIFASEGPNSKWEKGNIGSSNFNTKRGSIGFDSSIASKYKSDHIKGRVNQATRIGIPIAESTKQEDRRFKERSIGTGPTVGPKSRTSAKVLLAVEAVNLGFQVVYFFLGQDDNTATEKDLALLGEAAIDLQNAMADGLIPPEYINIEDLTAILKGIFDGSVTDGQEHLGKLGVSIYNHYNEPAAGSNFNVGGVLDGLPERPGTNVRQGVFRPGKFVDDRKKQ